MFINWIQERPTCTNGAETVISSGEVQASIWQCGIGIFMMKKAA